MRRSCTVLALCLAAAPVAAKPRGGGGGHAAAANARAVGELAGKFKWGMSHEDCIKILADQVHTKYIEIIHKEQDVYKQDQLRQTERDDVQKIRDTYVLFDGHKTGWDVSIVDREFVHRNDESMLVMWEKDQRRFLFFFHDQLYKQYIAFNAEHPAFAGKSFDDFAKIIQNRYGQAEMKFSQLRSKEDMTLDHMEWPAAGGYQLWAVDQSNFYNNFSLVLFNPTVARDLDKLHGSRLTKPNRSNSLIEAVTQQPKVATDPNENIVDQIVGKKPTGKPTPQ